MSRVYKDTDYGEKLLRIRPEGWVRDLVFEYGYLHRSGQAHTSIGIRLDDDAGGVLTNDDLMAILEVIVNHFKRVAQETEDQVTDLKLKGLGTKKKVTSKSPTEATQERKDISDE